MQESRSVFLGLVRQVHNIRAVFSDEKALLLLQTGEEQREKSMLPVPAVTARRVKENSEEARSRREPTNKRKNSMRKIIVYNIISLDGYHTGLDNDVSVMFPMMGDKVFNAYTAEGLLIADPFLVG